MDEQTITEEDVATVAAGARVPPPPEPVVATDEGEDAALVFVAAHELWLDGDLYEAGLHRIKDPAAELVRLISHAHAAGVADVQRGLDLSGVQSQEDGEAAYAEAQGEPDPETGKFTGPWYVGHEAQAELDAAYKRVEEAREHSSAADLARAEDDVVRLSAEIDARLLAHSEREAS